jgi:anti-sigma factor RsiW
MAAMPPTRKNTAGSQWLSHLSEDDIEEYVAGAADPDEKSAIEQHIAMCADCRDRLKEALRRSA